jgi:hypothetical protein
MYDQSEVEKYRILGTEFPEICFIHNFCTKISKKVDRYRMSNLKITEVHNSNIQV